MSLNVTEIYIKWWLSLKHELNGFNDSNGLLGFSGFPFWFGSASVHSSV